MRKLLFMIMTVVLFSMLSSCDHSRYPVTSISMNNDDLSLSVKFCGLVKFTDDSTAIKSISPDGYLRYRKNDDRLTAESDENGNVSFAMYDNGKKLAMDEEGRRFLAEAVKEMIKQKVDKRGNEERRH